MTRDSLLEGQIPRFKVSAKPGLPHILAGDEADAKRTVSTFVGSLGFAPVALGELREGRLMQVGGGPLVGLHVVKLA